MLTHSAGADCDAPLLVALAQAGCAAGLTVLRCNLPFRQLRPHGPPPRSSAETDRQGLRAAIAALREHAPKPLFLGGHSYGGRQASMLAAEEPGLVEALLLLSYPLHPPRRRAELRTAHFPQLHTPCFFVHGSRDTFGSLDEMKAAVSCIAARTELFEVASAGHELLTGSNRNLMPAAIAHAFLRFARQATLRPSL